MAEQQPKRQLILPHEPPFTLRHTIVDNGIVFPPMITQSQLDYVRNEFPFRNGDAFVATYPKSGTTWTQSIIKLLLGFDDSVRITEAVPWLERGGTEESEEIQSGMRLPSDRPRCFKTHDPWQCVAKSRGDKLRLRYIHVARNPKDVCVSMYHHTRGFQSFEYGGDFDHFFQLFVHGEVESGPWLDFNLGYYEASKRYPSDILLLTYEDMHLHPGDNVMRIAEFLGIDCSRGRAQEIAELTSFRALKNDPAANYSWAKHRRNKGEPDFMRKGEVGDWKNYFSEEQERMIEERMIRVAKEAGLVIPHSL